MTASERIRKARSTDAKLVSVGSHSVSLGHNGGGLGVEKEECFPVLTATWRGHEVTVTMEANRYVHSEGWSEWRVFVRSADGLTDTARGALNEACRPIVLEWLESDEYRVSRSFAFRNMLRYQLREERFSVNRSEELLAKYQQELDPVDFGILSSALEHLRLFLELVSPS